MPYWHAEVIALVLRRYAAAATPDEAARAFSMAAPYDGTGLVRIDLGRAAVGPLLVAGADMTRDDYRQLETVLRQHGARELVITRHGRMVVRPDAAGPV